MPPWLNKGISRCLLKIFFFWVSMRVFLEEVISVKDPPPPVCWRRHHLIFLSLWAETFICSCPWTWELLVLEPMASDWELHHLMPWFSGLQTGIKLYHWLVLLHHLAFSMLWHMLASIVTLANSYSKSPLIYLFIYPIGSVSLGGPWLVHTHYLF